MSSSDTDSTQYRIWGADHVAYGPVELPTVIHWVKEGRVLPDSWIFLEQSHQWKQARTLDELKMFFQNDSDNSKHPSMPRGTILSKTQLGLKPGTLRRMKILSGLDNDQLARFIDFMEAIEIKQFRPVVRTGDIGDAMYLILEGEVRAAVKIDGREAQLSKLGSGEFFGEISLLDQGPRSADIIANEDTILLKISVESFENLIREAPGIALPFLFSLSKTVVGRLRSITKRYEDSILLSRKAAEV